MKIAKIKKCHICHKIASHVIVTVLTDNQGNTDQAELFKLCEEHKKLIKNVELRLIELVTFDK